MDKKEYFKTLLKWPISQTARRKIKNYRTEQKINKIKLIMTLVVKNEEKIILQNILFHKEMGVDGFIVTSHNSTDKTNEILENLKEQGVVLEIIYKTTPDHKHHVWVNDMVKIAKKKYKADWIINADADEFYYSKSLSLKKSIDEVKNSNINVLFVGSTYLFPDDREDFLSCPYFITNRMQEFEAEALNLQEKYYDYFVKKLNCCKMIHSTQGVKTLHDGNHDIEIKNKVKVQSADICLYHYHTKNYKEYEEKVIRWASSASLMPKGTGTQIKESIEIYQNGKLRDHYDSIYGKEMKEFLMEQGVVTIDKSVQNFLRYKNII